LFKNLLVYRLAPEWSADLLALEEGLDKLRFMPCGPTQPLSLGWVPPRGHAGGLLVESIGGHWLLKLTTERRVLPGAVVKRRTDELAARIEQETGRKPGKKQTKELKEQVVQELLPMAFTKQSSTWVWLDPQARFMMVDASSPGKADEVITALVKAADGLAVLPLHTAMSAGAAMTDWLATGEPPSMFTVDRDCELKSADETKSVVRYARHPLDIEEVRQHIADGKLPTRLALTWEARVSLMLTDTMQLKKLQFLDIVFEGHKPGKEEAFDADVSIATTELSRLIPDLIEALGGEQVPGSMPAAPGAAAAPTVSAAPAALADTAPWD
jgi:recombination associated protein RdgC